MTINNYVILYFTYKWVQNCIKRRNYKLAFGIHIITIIIMKIEPATL